MLIVYNFLSSRDEKTTTKNAIVFLSSRRVEHVSGDLEKSSFMFDPLMRAFDPDTLCSNFATLPKIRLIDI